MIQRVPWSRGPRARAPREPQPPHWHPHISGPARWASLPRPSTHLHTWSRATEPGGALGGGLCQQCPASPWGRPSCSWPSGPEHPQGSRGEGQAAKELGPQRGGAPVSRGVGRGVRGADGHDRREPILPTGGPAPAPGPPAAESRNPQAAEGGRTGPALTGDRWELQDLLRGGLPPPQQGSAAASPFHRGDPASCGGAGPAGHPLVADPEARARPSSPSLCWPCVPGRLLS